MRRLEAVLATAVMIAVALFVRSRIDEDGAGTRSVRLLCATELEAACTTLHERNDEVTVSVEPAGQTATFLSTAKRGDIQFDGWLAPSPWPQLAGVLRRVNGLDPALGAPSRAVARSPLVIVVRKDRASLVDPSCGAPPWKCLGDAAGRRQARPGYGDPTTNATALLVLSQATSEFLGKPEYSRADLEDEAYLDWLTGLQRAVPAQPATGETPFAQMLQALPTLTYDALGTTEAEAGPGLATAARDRRAQLTLIYPEPVVTADVVFVAVTGAKGGDDARSAATGGDARAAFAKNGWRVAGESRVPGVAAKPALPRASGLPADAGVLVALDETWKGIAR